MSFNALQKAKIELDYVCGKLFSYHCPLNERGKAFYLALYWSTWKSFMYDRLKVTISLSGSQIRFNYGTYAVDANAKSIAVTKELLHRLTLTPYLEGLMWLDRYNFSFYFVECKEDDFADYYY